MISETLLNIKSEFVTNWMAAHAGSLEGCEEQWKREENLYLTQAAELTAVQTREANEKAAKEAELAKDMEQKRSTMSSADKAAFITKYGAEKFQSLAWA